MKERSDDSEIYDLRSPRAAVVVMFAFTRWLTSSRTLLRIEFKTRGFSE
jgi:hypothetical protein